MAGRNSSSRKWDKVGRMAARRIADSEGAIPSLVDLLPKTCTPGNPARRAFQSGWTVWRWGRVKRGGFEGYPGSADFLKWLGWVCREKCACSSNHACGPHLTLDAWIQRGGENPCKE